MIITFGSHQPAPAPTPEPAPALTQYDIDCVEAARRVRSGLCPLCGERVTGLSTTCGDPDCMAFVGEMPDERRWILAEVRALQASSLPPDLPPVSVREMWPALVAVGVVSAALVAVSMTVGDWLGWLVWG